MAELQSFTTSGGETVWMEVQSPGGGSPSLEEGLRPVAALAGALVRQIAQLPEEQVPDEMEVSFGLVAVDQGRFAVSRGSDGASLRVTLRWSGDAGRTPELVEGP